MVGGTATHFVGFGCTSVNILVDKTWRSEKSCLVKETCFLPVFMLWGQEEVASCVALPTICVLRRVFCLCGLSSDEPCTLLLGKVLGQMDTVIGQKRGTGSCFPRRQKGASTSLWKNL